MVTCILRYTDIILSLGEQLELILGRTSGFQGRL